MARVRRGVRLGVPAYFYPWPGDVGWQRLADDRGIVIVDPANGPGTAVDTNYVAAVEAFDPARTELLGYVDSSYGRRDPRILVNEARRHREWYGVTGVFVDQVSGAPQQCGHYLELVRRLRDEGLRVALNPGQPQVEPALCDAVDYLCVFEGPLRQYLQIRFPAWMAAAGQVELWHLVYDVTDVDGYRQALYHAARHGAGVFYATDGRLPNPWDRLSPYWRDDSVDGVAG